MWFLHMCDFSGICLLMDQPGTNQPCLLWPLQSCVVMYVKFLPYSWLLGKTDSFFFPFSFFGGIQVAQVKTKSSCPWLNFRISTRTTGMCANLCETVKIFFLRGKPSTIIRNMKMSPHDFPFCHAMIGLAFVWTLKSLSLTLTLISLTISLPVELNLQHEPSLTHRIYAEIPTQSIAWYTISTHSMSRVLHVILYMRTFSEKILTL